MLEWCLLLEKEFQNIRNNAFTFFTSSASSFTTPFSSLKSSSEMHPQPLKDEQDKQHHVKICGGQLCVDSYMLALPGLG